jgi:hypothetical protein
MVGRGNGQEPRIGKDLHVEMSLLSTTSSGEERQADVHGNLYLLIVPFVTSMTFTPPSGPIIRAVKPLPVVETSKVAPLKPGTAVFYQMASRLGLLIPLILGIFLIFVGFVGIAAPKDQLLALVLLILGGIFLAESLAGRRQVSFYYFPESSTALALYVAVEFLAGAVLAYSGIANLVSYLVSPSEGFDWSFVAVSAFGLLLATDSLIFYRRDIRQFTGKSKGV